MASEHTTHTDRWVVVIPQKDLRRAKSRIALDPARRQRLTRAMLQDTLAAVQACALVEHTVVVVDQAADSPVGQAPRVHIHVASENAGHNASVVEGESLARRLYRANKIAVLPSDLPALNPRALTHCLQAADLHRRSFLRDCEGTGTTLLAATAGAALLPRFGEASATHHAESGAFELADAARLDWASVRADVDDLPALKRAANIGLGDRTSQALGFIPDAEVASDRLGAGS